MQPPPLYKALTQCSMHLTIAFFVIWSVGHHWLLADNSIGIFLYIKQYWIIFQHSSVALSSSGSCQLRSSRCFLMYEERDGFSWEATMFRLAVVHYCGCLCIILDMFHFNMLWVCMARSSGPTVVHGLTANQPDYSLSAMFMENWPWLCHKWFNRISAEISWRGYRHTRSFIAFVWCKCQSVPFSEVLGFSLVWYKNGIFVTCYMLGWIAGPIACIK